MLRTLQARRLQLDCCSVQRDGTSRARQEESMADIRSWSGLVSVALLSVGLACASARAEPPPAKYEPAAQSDQNPENPAVRRAEPTRRDNDEPDGPSVADDLPARDETVGLRSTEDRAPRDVREPFDE